MSTVEFSVIIPTYNRVDCLIRTLTALRDQEPEPSGVGDDQWEVVVVDDGSTDRTRQEVGQLAFRPGVPIHYFSQQNRKQGAARNLGVRHAAGRILLFLGDDVVPGPGFVQAHRRAHRNQPETTAVLGYTRWPPDYRVTRFMHYVGEEGWQFGFSLIDDPEDVPYNFFYTSNVSLDRRLFLRAGGFDEDFNEYGWEDMELSLRLRNCGMQLIYRPDAVAFHYHPTTFSSFVERQQRVGASAWTFYQKHPEAESILGIEKVPDYTRARVWKMEVLSRICRWTEAWRWPDLSRFYPDVMSYHYHQGIIRAKTGSP